MNVKSHSRLFGWKRKVACSSMHKDHALSRQHTRGEGALYRSDDVAATGRAGGAEQPFLAAALDVHRDGLFAQR